MMGSPFAGLFHFGERQRYIQPQLLSSYMGSGPG